MQATQRVQKLSRFVRTFIHENNYGPTYEEMSLGIWLKSKSNIKPYLERLKRTGIIDYIDGIPRAIWLVGETIRTLQLPLFGNVSAGFAIAQRDDQEPSEYLSFAASQFPKGIDLKSLYVLRVDGDSMNDASIHDRDLVVISRTAERREGDTIVFHLIDEQATTLKKYYHDGEYVLLQPANPKYTTKRKHQDLVQFHGKVIQVIRNYCN